ncbi:MAG: Bax inhibitor-1/YccA family protein [Erysipelotrichaceae bacterium]|nr:Bax inhibitor-1/YccA family protein [Erysipelotrichaceae bacterium]
MSFNQNYMQYEDGFRTYLNKTFLLMGSGLLVTALAAFGVLFSIMSGGIMYRFLTVSSLAPLLLCVIQLGVVIFLNAKLGSISIATARVLFFVYAGITGVNIGSLAVYYGITLMFVAFIFAGIMFFSCALIGYTTNVDLSRFSGLLMGGLIAVALLSIVSLFFSSIFYGMNMIVAYLGVFVFLGLTAWDVQKLKKAYSMISPGEMAEKYAVIGALELYLDFINLFMYVLRILGNSRRRN